MPSHLCTYFSRSVRNFAHMGVRQRPFEKKKKSTKKEKLSTSRESLCSDIHPHNNTRNASLPELWWIYFFPILEPITDREESPLVPMSYSILTGLVGPCVLLLILRVPGSNGPWTLVSVRDRWPMWNTHQWPSLFCAWPVFVMCRC